MTRHTVADTILTVAAISVWIAWLALLAWAAGS